MDFSAGLLRVRGGVNGWVATNAGRFNLEGFLENCIGFEADFPIIGEQSIYVCQKANALVSSRGRGRPARRITRGTNPIPTTARMR